MVFGGQSILLGRYLGVKLVQSRKEFCKISYSREAETCKITYSILAFFCKISYFNKIMVIFAS